MDDVTKNEKPCTLCEEFATEALNYLSENKTQTEIIGILNKSCFRIPTFKKQVYIELWLSDNYVLKFNAIIPFFHYIYIYITKTWTFFWMWVDLQWQPISNYDDLILTPVSLVLAVHYFDGLLCPTLFLRGFFNATRRILSEGWPLRKSSFHFSASC